MPPVEGVDPALSVTGCARWEPGRWTLQELQLVQFAVERLADAMGGPEQFHHFIGLVEFRKTPFACGRGCTRGIVVELMDNGRPPDPNMPPSDLIIREGVNFDAWTIVHELGHVWDAHWGWHLSWGLMRFTGGYIAFDFMPGWCDPEFRLPGCSRWGYFYGGIPPKGSDIYFNPQEDFAESVAAYVFPEEAQQWLIRTFRTAPEYYEMFVYSDYRETLRWEYVNGLIKGTIVVP